MILKKEDLTQSDVMAGKRKAEFKSSVRPDVVSQTYIFATRGDIQVNIGH